MKEELQKSVMSYSITLTICFWLLLRSTAIETKDSTRDSVFQGINNVAVDFHSQTNKTSKMVSSDGTWIWQPVGPEKNTIKSESILHLFPDDSGSGFYEEEPVNDTQKVDEIWISNVTNEYTTPSPVTLDTKRNKTEEKVHLVYERNLRKTNWCFKDTEHTKPIYKKTEMCCRKHKECQARQHVKRGIFNCWCHINFHICLKNAKTKMARSIERMYFNRNIVCYKKQRQVCKNESCADVYTWKIIPRHLK